MKENARAKAQRRKGLFQFFFAHLRLCGSFFQ
jgi:hypothetical protein